MRIKISDCPKHDPPWSPAMDRRLISAREAGVTLANLAARFGVSEGACAYRIKTLQRNGRKARVKGPP
ncbi:MAG: winged helix-turn-helix transcriptional regulator [Beijerinckiaceae bacterium]|nr:winged helix-turn-helix transcriptional regulator [Beijerinckiaceae bacterium]